MTSTPSWDRLAAIRLFLITDAVEEILLDKIKAGPKAVVKITKAIMASISVNPLSTLWVLFNFAGGGHIYSFAILRTGTPLFTDGDVYGSAGRGVVYISVGVRWFPKYVTESGLKLNFCVIKILGYNGCVCAVKVPT